MAWGTFTITHIVSLIISGVVIGLLHHILKKTSEKIQRMVLFVLSLSGMAAIIFNLVAWNSPIEYLPFHMCSINAILLPIAIATKNKTLGNLLLLWCVGALIALVANFAQGGFLLNEPTFWFYYLPHTFEFGIPILLFSLGIFQFEPKYIWSTIGITAGIFIVVHFINLGLNKYCIDKNILDWAGKVVQVNYMYTVEPDANPLLELFWSWNPRSFFYMLPSLGIVAIYELCLYIAWHIKQQKKAR